jgi:hypothetical protein
VESVRVEHCRKCESTNLTNLVYVHTGDPVRVYVQCSDCGAFVARYVLSRYTSDQTYECLLRTLRRYAYASGKRALQEVEECGTTVQAEFERVKKLAREQPDSRPVVELIEDAREGEKKQDPES